MSILTKAEELVNGDRQKDYGDPRENCQRIAGLWSAFLSDDSYAIEVEPEDVAMMMMMVKMARLMETPDHEDSWVDIAGYAWVGNECTK